jgi:hypothetical protein
MNQVIEPIESAAANGERLQNFTLDKARHGSAQAIRDAAIGILLQGAELVRNLSADDYARRVPAVFNASIGGHYRHCLDHFSSLLAALHGGIVDYDCRQRDKRLESDPDFAFDVTRTYLNLLEELSPDALSRAVNARCEVSYAQGCSPISASSIAREMVYCIAHAIHHYALIAVMAKLMKVDLPPHFGVAPSTVKHEQSLKAGDERG